MKKPKNGGFPLGLFYNRLSLFLYLNYPFWIFFYSGEESFDAQVKFTIQ